MENNKIGIFLPIAKLFRMAHGFEKRI